MQLYMTTSRSASRARCVLDYRWVWGVLLLVIMLGRYTAPVLAECFEHQKLTASVRQDGERFARSISISGDLAVFGAAPSERAIVFRRSGTAWVEEQSISLFPTAPTTGFGQSVSVSGNRILVGSSEACRVGEVCGGAYTFRFDGTSWLLEQALSASDIVGPGRFGRLVALDGSTAVVTGAGADCYGIAPPCGAAYVFRFDGSSWVEEQKLPTPNTTPPVSFGNSIALSGDTIVVGSILPPYFTLGRAHVFRFDGSAWAETQVLTAAGASSFASSMAMSGNVLLVGSPWDDCSPGINKCGAAYVFRFDGSSWVLEQRLVASNAADGDEFGFSVALSGDTAIINAPFRGCVSPTVGGPAYVFRFDGTSWQETEQLVTASFVGGCRQFQSTAIDGQTAILGAGGDGCGAGTSFCGAAFVYELAQPCPSCGDGQLNAEESCDGGLGCTNCVCDSGFVPTTPRSIDCQPIDPNLVVPAASIWSLIVMTLIAVCIGASLFRRDRMFRVGP